jgi:hypothetical protein
MVSVEQSHPRAFIYFTKAAIQYRQHKVNKITSDRHQTLVICSPNIGLPIVSSCCSVVTGITRGRAVRPSRTCCRLLSTHGGGAVLCIVSTGSTSHAVLHIPCCRYWSRQTTICIYLLIKLICAAHTYSVGIIGYWHPLS